jgi:histone acetyltransferase (RNA polymerase elongator complex component)
MAESIAKQKSYPRISVIAWVWVREYYARKHGYALDGTYMVKWI